MTPKQEGFVRAYIELGDAAKAYRAAYNAERMKPATIWKRASELMSNGEVTGRIEELRQAAAESAKLTLKNHLDMLAELRDNARNLEQMGAAVSAEVSRGKAAGLYATRQEVTGKEGGPIEIKSDIDLSRYTEEELMLLAQLVSKDGPGAGNKADNKGKNIADTGSDQCPPEKNRRRMDVTCGTKTLKALNS
ncbi:MAG: terminase small subunit [Synergistaceae bacterium]|jgi:hypothetical protein|nr:terminase small subunit [Synergistaceae bacterium]